MKKNNANGSATYTLMSNASYNNHNGWKENKKKVMYVVPKLNGQKWKDNVDKMYIGSHLINDFHGTYKKSANVDFSYFFQVYSVQSIKAGDELLANYKKKTTKQRLGGLTKR